MQSTADFAGVSRTQSVKDFLERWQLVVTLVSVFLIGGGNWAINSAQTQANMKDIEQLKEYDQKAMKEDAELKRHLAILVLTVQSLTSTVEAQQMQICAMSGQSTCVPVKIIRPPDNIITH